MLAIALLSLGIISRLITHIPNFTPIIALSLFSGVYLKRSQAVVLPLLLLAVTDISLGFHETMFYTYGSVLLISCIGLWLKSRKSVNHIALTRFCSSVLFFIITNFGVWLASGMYPMTASGLSQCFILAIPFFKTELISTVLYTAIFFGAYEWMASRIKSTRFAHVL